MKLIFTSCFVLILALSTVAQNYSISNVQFDHNQGDTLLPGEFVNFTYDYTKTGGDIRISGRPNVTSGPGSALKAGYALKTDDVGSGDARFSYSNGKKIESVIFRFVDLDWTDIYDTIFPFEVYFHTFMITNLQLTPASPAILGIGDSIKLNFNFNKTYGNVKIIPIALSNGSTVHKQTTPVLPVQSQDTGVISTFIKIDTLAYVDQIMFQFLDATTNDTLLEVTNDVYFTFTNDINTTYSISNVVCDPSSPGNVGLNEDVNISFDYTKPYGDVRIYVNPIVTEGSHDLGTGGSSLYTENSGVGSGRFVFFGESKVEQLVFRIKSPSGILLYEYFEDVFFTISSNTSLDYSITDIKLIPESPANLNTGDTINISFKYTKPFGEVRFFIKPFSDGELNTGYETPNQITYSNNIDSVETFIIYDIATSFDQIKIQMQTSQNRLLVEETVNVGYTFVQVPFAISNIVLNPASPSSLSFHDSLQITFDYKNLEGQANVKLLAYANGQLLNGTNNIAGVLNNNSGQVSAFLKVTDTIRIDQVKIRIEDVSGNLISETSLNVNIDFLIPTFSNEFDQTLHPNIFPIPATNELNIWVPAENFEITLVNSSGMLIKKIKTNSNQLKLDVSQLKSGLYFTSIKFNNKNYSSKVVIK